MHYTTRVQIAQEKQLERMVIATNALQLAATIRKEEQPATASAMDANLRDIVFSLPCYKRTNTFPGSEPNREQSATLDGFEAALAQRPNVAEIPATGAGQSFHHPIARAKVSRISMQAAQSGAVYDGGFISERTEEAKGRPDARDQLRAERLATA